MSDSAGRMPLLAVEDLPAGAAALTAMVEPCARDVAAPPAAGSLTTTFRTR